MRKSLFFVLILASSYAGLALAPAPAAAVKATPGVRPADTVSVVDYGATADDATDDTAAIRAACVDAVARDLRVWVPRGKFITSTLTIPDGTRILGVGRASWLSGALRFGSDCSIRRLMLGSRQATLTLAPARWSTHNIWVGSCRLRGGSPDWNGAIFHNGSGSVSDMTFNACKFERNYGVRAPGVGAGAVMFFIDQRAGYDSVVSGIRIQHCHFGVANGNGEIGQPTFNIVFCRSVEGSSGWFGGIEVVDNVFEAVGEFSLDFGQSGNGPYVPGHSDVLIRGNVIKGAGLGDPIWGYGICTEPTHNGTVIEGNLIYRCQYTAIKLTKDTDDTIVRNNVIDYREDNGVVLAHPSYHATIAILEGCLRNTVTGNTIYLPPTPKADPATIENNGGSTNVITGNRIIQ